MSDMILTDEELKCIEWEESCPARKQTMTGEWVCTHGRHHPRGEHYFVRAHAH